MHNLNMHDIIVLLLIEGLSLHLCQTDRLFCDAVPEYCMGMGMNMYIVLSAIYRAYRMPLTISANEDE